MRILLANPRGFCAGVDRAIVIVKHALEMLGAPIYVYHEIVHNQTVLKALQAQGAVFVEEIAAIPPNANVIFSAHGVSPQIQAQAKQRDLRIFDATCPLVTKVHMEVAHLSHLGYECILIGHGGHPEVEGTLGHYDCAQGGIYLIEHEHEIASLSIKNPAALGYVTQTTLLNDATQQIVAGLKQRFPMIRGPKKSDICYATQNRQNAVKALTQHSDIVLVVGSKNSSNSNRLRELAEQAGKPAYLIDTVADIQTTWLTGKSTIGITAGASAPETLVQAVIEELQALLGAHPVSELAGPTEKVHFALPRELYSS